MVKISEILRSNENEKAKTERRNSELLTKPRRCAARHSCCVVPWYLPSWHQRCGDYQAPFAHFWAVLPHPRHPCGNVVNVTSSELNCEVLLLAPVPAHSHCGMVGGAHSISSISTLLGILTPHFPKTWQEAWHHGRSHLHCQNECTLSMLEPKTARVRKSEAVMTRCQKQTLCTALFLSQGDVSPVKDVSPAPSSPKENFLCLMARMVLSCMGSPKQHLRIPLAKCTEPGQDPIILFPFLVLLTGFFILQPSC